MLRPPTSIPENVQSGFPIIETSEVICGFGRGSSELGIPTANIPVNASLEKLDTGIYFGWCRIIPNLNAPFRESHSDDGRIIAYNNGTKITSSELCVFPMVMSIGWNPFYHNKEKAAEVHIIHNFSSNFYGAEIKYIILGYIRPELNYTSKGMFSFFLFFFSLV